MDCNLKCMGIIEENLRDTHITPFFRFSDNVLFKIKCRSSNTFYLKISGIFLHRFEDFCTKCCEIGILCKMEMLQNYFLLFSSGNLKCQEYHSVLNQVSKRQMILRTCSVIRLGADTCVYVCESPLLVNSHSQAWTHSSVTCLGWVFYLLSLALCICPCYGIR